MNRAYFNSNSKTRFECRFDLFLFLLKLAAMRDVIFILTRHPVEGISLDFISTNWCLMCVFDNLYYAFIYLFVLYRKQTSVYMCYALLCYAICVCDDDASLVVFIMCCGWHSRSHTLDLAQCKMKRREKKRQLESNWKQKKKWTDRKETKRNEKKKWVSINNCKLLDILIRYWVVSSVENIHITWGIDYVKVWISMEWVCGERRRGKNNTKKNTCIQISLDK